MAPEPCGCHIGALPKRFQLQPDSGFDNPFSTGEGSEPAVGTGDNPLPITDRLHCFLNSASDDFGMFNNVARRFDTSRQEHHVTRQTVVFKYLVLVVMPGS